MPLPFFVKILLSMRKCSSITIDSGFCILCAVCLLLFPAKLVFAWFFAAFIHELWHYVALKTFKIKILRISVHANGVIMQTAPVTYAQEILSALAGPIGGMSLVLFAPQMPIVALCAFLQSIHNLLPLYPLDGGRIALRLLQLIFGDEKGEHIYGFVKYLTLVFVLIFSILACVRGYGIMPILISILLIIKSTCKYSREIVK